MRDRHISAIADGRLGRYGSQEKESIQSPSRRCGTSEGPMCPGRLLALLFFFPFFSLSPFPTSMVRLPCLSIHPPYQATSNAQRPDTILRPPLRCGVTAAAVCTDRHHNLDCSVRYITSGSQSTNPGDLGEVGKYWRPCQQSYGFGSRAAWHGRQQSLAERTCYMWGLYDVAKPCKQPSRFGRGQVGLDAGHGEAACLLFFCCIASLGCHAKFLLLRSMSPAYLMTPVVFGDGERATGQSDVSRPVLESAAQPKLTRC